ncbi:MAG: Na(+)-translocating NADH-quinone reductase subunit C [Zetaproteobacteria bacterium]|nr:Na(+)-translocating NADH-quinone reductase subunit C [Zetaproteobacteria bacterium]
MSLDKDSVPGTITIAVVLSLFCSVLVSVAAVALRPLQEENQRLDKKKNILAAAGLLKSPEDDVNEVYAKYIRPKVVDLETGEVDTSLVAEEYDQYKVGKDPSQAVRLQAADDIAGIRMIAPKAVVYEVYEMDKLTQVVLPIHGKGLWSTLYGFLSVKADGNSVQGIGFYSHMETPGLGGEVDNPTWKASWNGKEVYDADGNLKLEVIKGAVDLARADAKYQVDGLSGATITARGVSNLVRFWTGRLGFRKYLKKLSTTGEDA